MFLRLSVPAGPGDLRPEIAAIQDYLGTLPDPTYGGQLQTFGIIGHRAPTVYLKQAQAISSDLVKEGHG